MQPRPTPVPWTAAGIPGDNLTTTGARFPRNILVDIENFGSLDEAQAPNCLAPSVSKQSMQSVSGPVPFPITPGMQRLDGDALPGAENFPSSSCPCDKLQSFSQWRRASSSDLNLQFSRQAKGCLASAAASGWE